MSSETQQLCCFYLDENLFGVEVERVQEIIRFLDITPVPLAPREVAGMINLRGQIVPALSLRRCFKMSELAAGELPTNVILRTEDGPVSLLVDRIGEVLEVAESAYEPPPENLHGRVRALVRGVYKLDGQLLMLLAAEAAIALSTDLGHPQASPSTPAEK